jgi:hypothetical protein
MRSHSQSIRLELAFVASALLACGAPPAPATQNLAAPPVAQPAAPPPPSAQPAEPVASAPPEPAPAPPPSASDAPPESTALERSQKPIDMITARDAAFLIDYANSAPKQKAQEKCERESKGDPEKLGACLAKEREQFLPDVLRFKKDSETQTSLVVYKRSGSTLKELAIAAVTLTEEGDAVRVKFGGRYKGARPIWRGRPEGKLTAPNDYSIEIEDPELGHLRYDAKIGLVTD